MESVCAVAGVGPGNGRAYVERFARAGYRVAMLARNGEYLQQLESEIENSRAFPADLTDPQALDGVFAGIRTQFGPVRTLIFNAGGGAFESVESASLEDFERAWRINVYALAAAVKGLLPQLRAQVESYGQAEILITGASAAWRGRAQTAPFASAKAAQRSLAQSMARQLGPEKIHVAYLVIDGVVDLPRTRRSMPDRPDSFFVDPQAVAEIAWQISQQDPSAWVFETDLRPFGEDW